MKNKKIKNASKCSLDSIKFKSQLEKSIYTTLKELGFNPLYEPTTFTLWPGFSPITSFYDKETDSQYKKRIKNGDTNKNRQLVLKKEKVIGIRYTPDFFIKFGNINVYIEAKGKENEVFYIKKKLFRFFLDQEYLQTNQQSLYFEVYTKKQLIQAIQIMKDYEKSIRENTGTNTSSS